MTGIAVGGPSGAQPAVAAVVSRSHATIPPGFAVVRVRVDETLTYARRAIRRLRTLVGLPELAVLVVGRLRADFPHCYSIPMDEGVTDQAPGGTHVGVSIDVGTGLYVPVVRDADRLGLREIGDTLLGYRRAAIRGAFRSTVLTGATIMVTLGTDDVLFTRPIIFPGQVCAVSVGAATPRPQWNPHTGQPETTTVVQIGLSYDHRLLGARDAVDYLQALRARLESPGGLDARVD